MIKDFILKILKRIYELKVLLCWMKKQNKHHYYHSIVSDLKKRGITNIQPFAVSQWKIQYDCIYFKGKKTVNNKRIKVFIKIVDSKLKDCWENEQKINDYIDKNSEYIKDRKPAILDSFHQHDSELYYLILEYFNITPVQKESESQYLKEIQRIIDHYSNIGIIHSDFLWGNIGLVGKTLMFFDYGTSLFQESNNIRLRNAKVYNHLSSITDPACALLPDADYYYDDISHMGFEKHINRDNINFIVGKEDKYYAKLGNMVIEYRLEKVEDDDVYLLKKTGNTNRINMQDTSYSIG